MLEFNKEAIDPRIFIVGCSRSGTTLLQTLIASHPDLTTFPETNFFHYTIGTAGWKRTLKQIITTLGLATGQETEKISGMLDRLDQQQLKHYIPCQPLTYSNSVNIYLSFLDKIAINRDAKKAWVEKTPKHIFNVYWILRYVPNGKVIHIVRDGREVVSSIIKRARQYPDMFGEQDIDYAINLWNKSIKVSEKYVDNKDNYIVKYEDLVKNTPAKLQEMGEFINLDYSEVNIKDRNKSSEKSIEESEQWKKNVKGPIKNKNSKFMKMFTTTERKYILKKLTDNIFYDF